MRKLLLSLCMVVATFGTLIHDAEAARLGGGKSVGMQRQSVTRPSSTPATAPAPAPARNTAAPATQPAPAAAPAPAPQRNRWLGPLAGLAAGIGLGALLGSGGFGGMGGMLSSLLMIAALVMVAMFAVRMFRRQAPVQDSSFQYAGGPSLASAPAAAPVAPSSFGGAAIPANSAPRIPADFDVEGFIRVAKLNFIRLQAANDEGNLEDLRQFLTPEMFAEVKMQLVERGKTTQQTDVQQLEAEVLDVVDEGGNHIASVRFHGLIREDANTPAAPFDEVWNLIKPLDGSHGWSIAGIQQLV